jgi:hypothetical protein
MHKRTQPTTLALLATSLLGATLHAQPPMARPAKLPSTPAHDAKVAIIDLGPQVARTQAARNGLMGGLHPNDR